MRRRLEMPLFNEVVRAATARRAWNATISPVRCRIEKVFGTAKRMGQARYMVRRRVSLPVYLTFIAYNVRRAAYLPRAAPA